MRTRREAFGEPVDPSRPLGAFLDGLGDVLAVRELRALASAIVAARRADAPVFWALGGHVVKVGLAPVLGRLIDGGWITGLALNGAAAIHDWEIAALGRTSEDVEAGLEDGSFGDAPETAAALGAACRDAVRSGDGLGASLAGRMLGADLPHADASLIVRAARAGIPVTVHVAIGCDTVHIDPGLDGAALGAATLRDLHRLSDTLRPLQHGVWINCGSAVQLPEVFLKALTLARRTGGARPPFVTADLDMQRHYRTERNVLRRPTTGGGRGIRLIGHHEINVPLLAAAIEHAAADPECASS